MYYLYILENSHTGKFYIGSTNNIKRRLHEHNSNNKSKYTSKQKGIWKLLLAKKLSDRKEAYNEELRLKQCKSRNYIVWYINQHSRAAHD